MSVDYQNLLYRWLPGLYRDKDTEKELRRFLAMMARPLAEIDAAVGQMHEDTFIATCRPELIPMIGGLVGVEVDATLPARAQREQVRDAIAFYRSKGTREALRAYAESLTGWRVQLVDFSERVARVPYVETMNPVELVRDGAVRAAAGGTGFHFREDGGDRPLFDAVTGRPITRAALAGHETEYAGAPGRFSIAERGVDLFLEATPPAGAVAADLGDFAHPRTPAGAALTLGAGQVAVDPLLSRFLVGGAAPLAGNLRVTYHALTPGSVRPQTTPVGDPSYVPRIGRSDDPLPYALDVRAPRGVADRTGYHHFDNQGLYCTPARVVQNHRPNALAPAGSGRFTFDDRPLAVGDAVGVPLQLLDGVDASPLTRRDLDEHPRDLCGTPRGFAIRVGGVDITDPRRFPALRLRAVDLGDFGNPRDPEGAAITLAAHDVAVDPQLGRFVMDLTALGAAAADVRVDYLLGAASAVQGREAAPVSGAPVELVALDSAADVPLVDAFDGTPVSVAVRLGRPAGDYHGTARGWRVRRNETEVTATLAVRLMDLGDLATTVPAGNLGVDADRGRLRFPQGGLAATDRVTVDHAFADGEDDDRRFGSLAQHLPRALPAGVVAVVADTRRRPPDLATLA
jgi:phage tail-like protein